MAFLNTFLGTTYIPTGFVKYTCLSEKNLLSQATSILPSTRLKNTSASTEPALLENHECLKDHELLA